MRKGSKKQSKFQRLNQEQRTQSVETNQSLGFLKEGFDAFFAKKGLNRIRLLPCLANDAYGKMFGADIYQYFIGNRLVLPPNTFGKSDKNPFYTEYEKLQARDDPNAVKFRGAKRRLMWLYGFKDEEDSEVDDIDSASIIPVIYSAPVSVYTNLIALARNRRTGEIMPIDDPETGEVVEFERAGEGLKTQYQVFKTVGKMPISESVADLMAPLDQVVNVLTLDEAHELVAQLKDVGDGDVDVDSTLDNDAYDDDDDDDDVGDDVADDDDSVSETDSIVANIKKRQAEIRKRKGSK